MTHKPQGWKNLYLVKWKGYLTSDNTWEPEQNLDNAKQILEDYKTQHDLSWEAQLEIPQTAKLLGDTFKHQHLQWNMSILQLWTNSI